MQLMVYAPYGRTGIYMLQEFCRQIGIRATDDEIRDLIAALKALPPGHPLENLLREAPDFRHEAGLADALLHPQDRAYSVPQFFDFIDRGKTDIRPVGETGALHSSLRCPGSNPAGFPDRPAWPGRAVCCHRAFRGTMVSHSAIVYRNDNPAPKTSVSPVTTGPDMCPADGGYEVPAGAAAPGAAAVLIYPGHTFRDLVMPIDATELSLFAGIDGNRSIGDIVRACVSWQHRVEAGCRPAASSNGCGGTTRWCSTRHGNARRPVCRPAWHLDTAEKNL